MKNKNGFIATSLILTFFLLFCALLISTVSNYNFNQNLIDKLKDIDVSGDAGNNASSFNDITIIAYVDDVEVTDFPTTSNYVMTSKCSVNGANDSSVEVTGKWVTDHWRIDVNNVTKSRTVCNVYFTNTDCPSEAPTGWCSAASGTLLMGIRANYNEPSEPLTMPGKDVSTDEEAIMGATEDDYGTSYYFRGNVQNNYVAFAGMCWRIVRITGDGSIKLVLYNYSSDDCSITGDDLAFARYSGTTYETKFNEKSYYNANIGFMYGDQIGDTYAETHANKTKSTILTNLEMWYTNNITAYADKLADTIWCNDKSTTGTGLVYSESRYGSLNRAGTTSPSLICPNDNAGGKLSKLTVDDTTNGNGSLMYKIGLLTADEIVYAGLNWYVSGLNYLTSNVGTKSWWTLSPSHFNGSNAFVWYVGGDSILISQYLFYSSSIRPSISLKLTTTISSGNGTAESPFVVN